MKPQDLERHLRELTRDRDRAQGAHAVAIERLRSKFHCSTIKKAIRLLEEMKGKRKVLKLKYEEALRQFEKEYGSKIGEE